MCGLPPSVATCGITICNNPAFVSKYGFDLCLEHEFYIYNTLRVSFRGSVVAKNLQDGNLTHSAGLTYFIELPNANIKIGYSRDYSTFRRRMTDLAREFGGSIKVLCVIEAGMTMEALLHHQFSEHRITTINREQFHPDQEILTYAESQGIPEPARAALQGLWNVSAI